MPKPPKPLALPLSAEGEAILREDLRVHKLLRAFLWLETVPRGQRLAAALAVAADLGYRKSRFYERWRTYRRYGVQSLVRQRRSDFGSSRAYSPEVLEAIRQDAAKVRSGGVRRAWRAAGCPGSVETYRHWLKRFRKAR